MKDAETHWGGPFEVQKVGALRSPASWGFRGWVSMQDCVGLTQGYPGTRMSSG